MTVFTEGTDAPQSTSTPYLISDGDTFLGQLQVGDTDWIRIRLVAGETYAFGLVGVGALDDSVNDTFLRLINPAGNQVLIENDDGGAPGYFSGFTFTAQTTGEYFIDVGSYGLFEGGGYGVSVTSEYDRPTFNVELGAAVLYRPDATWSTGPGTPVEITWGFRQTGPAQDAQGNASPFSQLSAGQREAAAAAIAEFAAVCGLNFTQVNPGGTTNDATVLFGGYASDADGAGAYAYYPSTGPEGGDVWLNNNFVNNNLPFGSYSYFVMIHELGHAMGLAHPGDYNAAPGVNITYEDNAQFVEDSHQYTVMSYFDESNTMNDMGSFPDTLMMYDIYALQMLYGINTDANAGNTVYGFNATLGGPYDFTQNDDPFLCIWDGSGRDTLDVSGFSAAQRISLVDGTFSDVGGFETNVSIAVGAKIENAVGGSGNDALIGNNLANVLKGAGGRDNLQGAQGKDNLQGGKGNDVLNGGTGNDVLRGQAGSDIFVFANNSGRDTIFDFRNDEDTIRLDDALWTGTKTVQQVINQFASVQNGNILFDFAGADDLVIRGFTNLNALANDIVLI